MHENCVSNFWLWTTELGLALLATKKIQLAKKPRKQCMVFYHHAVTLHVITDYKNVFREKNEAPFSTFDSLWLAVNWIKCLCNMKTLVHILEFVAFRTRKQSLEWVASCKPDFCFDLQTAMKTCSLIFWRAWGKCQLYLCVWILQLLVECNLQCAPCALWITNKSFIHYRSFFTAPTNSEFRLRSSMCQFGMFDCISAVAQINQIKLMLQCVMLSVQRLYFRSNLVGCNKYALFGRALHRGQRCIKLNKLKWNFHFENALF